MKAQYYAALLSAVLLTTSATAQDASSKAIGFTVGPSFFALPDFDAGIVSAGEGLFSPKVDGGGAGFNVGLSGGMSLGKIAGLDAGLGLSTFATVGKSSSTIIDRFSGPGVVVVSGYTTPGGAAINLVTNSAPGNSSASANIDHTNPQGGGEEINVNNPLNPAGTVNNYGASTASGGNSFALVGVVTQQGGINGAGAYGAVAATDGGVFFGAGDLTGLTVTTDVRRNMIYSGADLTFAMATSSGDMSLQGYVGSSYRLLNQSVRTTTTIDIPEASPSATFFPLYSMERDETLTSHYFGGVVGFNVSKPVSNDLTFSLGVEGGAYYTRDSYEGREGYSISDGSLATVPLTNVYNANGIDLDTDGFAWSAKVSPSVTIALAPNQQLTFGGSVDYLSRVATLTRNGSVGTSLNSYAGTDDGALTYNGSSQTTNTLSFAPMWSFTPTVSFTAQF
jgi:hypothetical protein